MQRLFQSFQNLRYSLKDNSRKSLHAGKRRLRYQPYGTPRAFPTGLLCLSFYKWLDPRNNDDYPIYSARILHEIRQEISL